MPIVLGRKPGGGGGSSAPSGPAGGDLTGTYPNPTIGAGKVTAAQVAADVATQAELNAVEALAYWDAVITTTDTQSISNSTTLTNDTQLAFAITNGNSYYFDLTLRYDEPAGSGTPDIKIGVTPTTSTFSVSNWSIQRMTTAGAADFTTVLTITSPVTGGSDVLVRVWRAFGFFTVATASGTATVQWAQNSTSGNAVRRLPGSTLAYRALV